MAENDRLHMIILDESGDSVEINLVNTVTGDEVAPGVPIALAASDILSASFTANWYFTENSAGYYLDVATDMDFTAFVVGYEDLDVSNVNEYAVVGLAQETSYYYRIRAYNDTDISNSSSTITVTTTVADDLVDLDGNVYTTVTIGTQVWTVENFRCTQYADAAAIPDFGGYDDYYLPSKDELNEMYVELHVEGVGSFASDSYWSSSESDQVNAYIQNFATGAQLNGGKGAPYHVRACRSFNTATIYAIRDIGPAGGLIFYKNGDDYLEAATSDVSTAYDWSNITNVIIGTTSTAVGEGQNNTDEIIAQVGHTDSAAKLCDDITGDDLWAADTTGAYCWYDNDEVTYGDDYGALYNWYAVDNASGLAYLERDSVQEVGWRVPTDADWTTLSTYLGGDAIAGGKLKEIGLTHWNTPNTGATNERDFTALPGGYRNLLGHFFSIGNLGAWWSSTQFSASSAYLRDVYYNLISVTRYYNYKQDGFSVRLIKDV